MGHAVESIRDARAVIAAHGARLQESMAMLRGRGSEESANLARCAVRDFLRNVSRELGYDVSADVEIEAHPCVRAGRGAVIGIRFIGRTPEARAWVLDLERHLMALGLGAEPD